MSDFNDPIKSEAATSALAIEDLVRANAKATESMELLAQYVREETEARDRKIEALGRNQHTMRVLVGVGTAATVVLLLIAVFNASNIASQRRTADRQAAIAEQVAQTNHLLLDCANPAGTCGQANAVSQARLLDEVKKYELTGFYCIRNNPAPDDPKAESFLKCMNRLYPGGPQLQGR